MNLNITLVWKKMFPIASLSIIIAFNNILDIGAVPWREIAVVNDKNVNEIIKSNVQFVAVAIAFPVLLAHIG